MKVKSESEVAQSLLATPWTAVHQAPPSMGLSRQEYWSGVPLRSPMTPVNLAFAVMSLHSFFSAAKLYWQVLRVKNPEGWEGRWGLALLPSLRTL